MAITVVRGSWPMVNHLWELRLEAMADEGCLPTDPGLLARLQWETSGQLVNEGFLVIMAYDGVEPVGYITLSQGDFTGLNALHGFYVVGYFVKPGYRRGPASTRIALSVGRVMRDMGIPRIQGIVKPENRAFGAMLERHGFQEVGRVYELRGRGHEQPVNGPADGQEVHRPGGKDLGLREGRSSTEPAVLGGSAACDAVGAELADAVAGDRPAHQG